MKATAVAFAVAVAVPVSGGMLSGLATRGASGGPWFQGLAKPSWNPPRAAFPIVWTILYVVMGVASWLVWRRRAEMPVFARRALILYAIQLAVNLSWSVVFFSCRSLRGGLAVIMALCASLAATIFAFWKVSKSAALLLVPYAMWVAFATALNAAMVALNYTMGKYEIERLKM